MKVEKPQFATEAEMCAAFIAWLGRFPEWTAFNECCGWDILLVSADGTQIGVQAKLRLNLKVLAQAVEGRYNWHKIGPDFRAILVPGGHGNSDLCAALGLGVFEAELSHGRPVEFRPTLDRRGYEPWHFTNPTERHVLPRFVPDVPAGASGPVTLSVWKIAALEIIATLEVRGFVTRDDFRRAGIDHRRWTEQWLQPVPGEMGQWRLRADFPHNFPAQHPVVYPQVLAEMRARLATEHQQPRLL